MVMKQLADAKRRDVQFETGDWVMVKLRPHKQSSISGRQTGYSKLAETFYGPFKMLDRIGPTTYKLQLSEAAHIHLVFHCSMLKPFHRPPTDDSAPQLSLPPIAIDNQPLITPLAIVGTRQNSNSSEAKLQVLVQWDDLFLEDTKWEDREQLQA